MYKPNVVYSYNIILFDHKKRIKVSIYATICMNLENMLYKRGHTHTKNIYDSIYMNYLYYVKAIETESRLMVADTGERE